EPRRAALAQGVRDTLTRRLATVVALMASLAAAPAAAGATADRFTVDSTGDAVDATVGDDQCRTASNVCTLRAAIMESNSDPNAVDDIVFSAALGAATIAPATPLPPVAAKATIDGGGDITIAPGTAMAPGVPLLLISEDTTAPPPPPPTSTAAGSTLSRITLDGDPSGPGRAGPLLRIEVSDVVIDRVVARNSGDDGIEVGPKPTRPAPQRVRITRSPVFAYAPGAEPIALAAGANGDIAPPQSLRVGPRRADGALPVTGTSGDGLVELFRGNPATGPQEFVNDAQGGSFAFVLNPEPAPGEQFSATFAANGNTSKFSATATTPSDIESPRLLGGVATSLSDVRIQPSEPLDPATVQPEDFSLVMAGAERQVTAATPAPDGSSVTLKSATPWLNGEAGVVSLRAPGAVTDRSGNESPAVRDIRVGGAPGDFIAPLDTSLRVENHRKVCISKASRCPHPGAQVIFISSEPGDALFTIARGSRTLGERHYTAKAGRNRIRFDGRLRGRKLSAGKYKVSVVVEDAVGNVAPSGRSYPFTIVKTPGRR
ncbi:MAG: hypothetical protein QOJ12_908, partial [Thermoleophilales bacterium]|nr:hypothetical protein [Thermoleophilales bacterium]